MFGVGDFRLLSKLITKFYHNPNNFYKKEMIYGRKNLSRFHIKSNLSYFRRLIKKLI